MRKCYQPSAISDLLNGALVCLFGISAVTPLLKGSLPQTADGIIHLYRLVELDSLFQHGVLFSRWAPDLVYGLGLPLFNFYAPLSYYLAEVLHLLGLNLVSALKAAFCLAMLGSGVTMYLYVRDLFGEIPAIVAAVAYMYAPYQLYDSLFRGILPEALALAIFPLVMWSFRRLATLGDRRYILVGALGLAALPLTHVTSTLILLPLLVVYVVVLLLLGRARKGSGVTVAVALVLGLALSAFFTLPATLERQWVQIERGLIPPNLDYHHHFLSLAEVLSPPQPTDTGRMNPAVPRSLGLVQTIPAIAAMAGLRKKGKDQRAHILFFALILIASVAMMLPQSVALWDRLAPLAYLQFPFRWLGPASFAVAVLAGASVGTFTHSDSLTSPRFLVSAALLILLVLAALPMLYPGYQHSLPANPSLVEMMDMERRMGGVGATATGEYLPIWVEWVPPESLLEPMYRAGRPLKRLDTSTWPEGSTVLEETYTPTSGQATVQLTKMLRVFFDIHYFPGWRAYIDGGEVPIEPTPGQGRISFVVPAGEHVIRLQFEELPPRIAADAISVISLLILLAIILANQRISESANHELAKALSLRDGFTTRQAVIMAGLALSLLAAKVVYVDHHDTFFKWDFDGIQVKGAQHVLHINFDDKITLLGYDLSASTIRAGETLRLDLYWKAQRRLDISYGVQARLVDSALNVYAQQDNAHPGSYPTSWWEEGKYMKDTHLITVPENTPPGQYLLQVGLYDPSTLQCLPVLPSTEGEVGETATLQLLSVEDRN